MVKKKVVIEALCIHIIPLSLSHTHTCPITAIYLSFLDLTLEQTEHLASYPPPTTLPYTNNVPRHPYPTILQAYQTLPDRLLLHLELPP
jgi:hypothetical protein